MKALNYMLLKEFMQVIMSHKIGWLTLMYVISTNVNTVVLQFKLKAKNDHVSNNYSYVFVYQNRAEF